MSIQGAGDLAVARSPCHRDRVARAVQIIHDAAASGPCCVSVSWGKDSLVLLDLVMEHAPMAVLHWRWVGGLRPDGLDAVRDACLERYALSARVPRWEGPGSERRLHLRCPERPSGPPYLEVPVEAPAQGWSHTDRGSPERAAMREGLRRNADRMRAAYTDELEVEAALCGIRADESRGRGAHLRTRGVRWSSPYGVDIVAPLAWLRSEDVWALIAEREMPIPDHYARYPGGRDQARSELVEVAGAWSPRYAAEWAYAVAGGGA